MRAAKLTQSKHSKLGSVYNFPTNCKDYIQYEVDCVFHQFAQEGANGDNRPVAIVELPDGSIHSVELYAIRFTE